MVASNVFGRQVVVPLTNKSGGSVAAGDVVILDSANNDAFTTTTSAGVTTPIGVAQATIASNAVGPVLVEGYAALVNVNASVTRLQYGKTHTVAKQAAASASRTAGTFCTFLASGTTPDALIYPVDLAGAALTNPMTTKGDIILGDTGGTPTRLAAGTSGFVLTAAGAGNFPAWAALPGSIRCSAYHNTTQTIATATVTALSLNAEDYDTSTIHDVTTNNSRLTVPTTGLYLFIASTAVAPTSATGLRLLGVRKNGTTQLPPEIRVRGNNTVAEEMAVPCIASLTAGDYVEAVVYQDSGGNIVYGDASVRYIQNSLSCVFLGA